MNPDVKALWVAALRSGEYKQGKRQLRNRGKFCCLGVLCDLAVKAEVIGLRDYYASDGFPPDVVEEWAGFDAQETFPGGRRLDVTNDNGAAFDEIADIIEAHL
jgi:hypothetical protein